MDERRGRDLLDEQPRALHGALAVSGQDEGAGGAAPPQEFLEGGAHVLVRRRDRGVALGGGLDEGGAVGLAVIGGVDRPHLVERAGLDEHAAAAGGFVQPRVVDRPLPLVAEVGGGVDVEHVDRGGGLVAARVIGQGHVGVVGPARQRGPGRVLRVVRRARRRLLGLGVVGPHHLHREACEGQVAVAHRTLYVDPRGCAPRSRWAGAVETWHDSC